MPPYVFGNSRISRLSLELRLNSKALPKEKMVLHSALSFIEKFRLFAWMTFRIYEI